MADILIADDDANLRLYVATILREAGHDVAFAADGDQAVEFYKRGSYDVVIVDLILPKKNGVQVITALRAFDVGVRVIAISGNSPEQLEMAQEAGAQVLLPKPFEKEALMGGIATLLRRSTGWQGALD